MSNIMSPKFRISYPSVFKKKLNPLSKKEEYSCMALFPKGADLSRLIAAAKEKTVETWGVDPKKWPKNLRSPFRKHEEKIIENDDGSKVYPQGMEAGGIFLTFKSAEKPGVVQADGKTDCLESDIYAGCYCRATLSVYAYGHKGNTGGNCGISFGLQNIQKWEEGDPLGSRTKAQDDFAPIEGSGAITAGAGSNDATSLFS